MTGLLTRPDGRQYVFRTHDGQVLAWETHSDPCRGMTHKWDRLPSGNVTLFDVDDPPATTTYLPILATTT